MPRSPRATPVRIAVQWWCRAWSARQHAGVRQIQLDGESMHEWFSLGARRRRIVLRMAKSDIGRGSADSWQTVTRADDTTVSSCRLDSRPLPRPGRNRTPSAVNFVQCGGLQTIRPILLGHLSGTLSEDQRPPAAFRVRILRNQRQIAAARSHRPWERLLLDTKERAPILVALL